MSESGNLTIVLQAGGESRRMGRSKATVPFLGEPLIWRGIRRLIPLADEFIITTNEPENLQFLGDLLETGEIRLVRDSYEQRGALRGVCTAFEAATKDFVALVACDMIFPSRNLIAAELAALVEEDADIAAPKTKFGFEPFHAVYRRSTCLPVVKAEADAGGVKATSWFDQMCVVEFDGQRVAQAEPRGGCFINVNTPEELAEAEAKVLSRSIEERDGFTS